MANETFERGEVYDVVISHDDDCPLLTHTGACNCAPEFHNGRTRERYTPPAPAPAQEGEAR